MDFLLGCRRLGRPQFLGGLLQYTMFQNSMVFSIALFHSWQVKGNCYMGKDLRIYRVVLGDSAPRWPQVAIDCGN